jgi:hypothetical protein
MYWSLTNQHLNAYLLFCKSMEEDTPCGTRRGTLAMPWCTPPKEVSFTCLCNTVSAFTVFLEEVRFLKTASLMRAYLINALLLNGCNGTSTHSEGILRE